MQKHLLQCYLPSYWQYHSQSGLCGYCFHRRSGQFRQQHPPLVKCMWESTDSAPDAESGDPSHTSFVDPLLTQVAPNQGFQATTTVNFWPSSPMRPVLVTWPISMPMFFIPLQESLIRALMAHSS